MLESEMLSKGLSFLENNKQYKIVKQEVPFLSRCIDVILINEYDEIISIEFKVSKWRHAIEQAKKYASNEEELVDNIGCNLWKLMEELKKYGKDEFPQERKS